ncbi:MAG TPA: DUF4159 domain-containing protein [Chloroflexia bacterium]|nr:DUF4159 domain-containing protein [Chloroflexia bacterium]
MDDAVPRVQLKRVDPFLGLMIDADTWRDSHDYHRQAEYAHALALHGWGIVSGLEVEPADPPDRSVWIRPGVALDPEGRLIIVAQPFRYQINTQEAGPVYLVLMFREIPTQPAISIEDGKERPSRVLEAYAIYERERLPDQAHVELARMQLTAGKKPVRGAGDATAPKPDELDLRFREQAAIRPGPRATMGVWKPGDVPEKLRHHLAGPTRLLAAIESGNWRLRRRDFVGGDEPLDCDLLLMPVHTGTELSEGEHKQLTTFLDGGGVLLAEHCASAGGDAKRNAAALAGALNRQPQPIGRNHALLTAKHVFSTPPPAAQEGQIFEADGLVLSHVDYACAWNGGTPDKGLDRPTIRATVEFAENLLAYSLTRRGGARRAQRTEKKK